MDKAQQAKVELFMRHTKLKKLLILSNGKYFLCIATEDGSNADYEPHFEVRMEELPPPVELV